MRVRYMLGDIAIADRSKVISLPKVGDLQNLRTLDTDVYYQVKYTLPPMPGGTLAIVGLEEPET